MITVTYNERFKKDVGKLPKETQEKLSILISVLVENPFDRGLHTKRLAGPLDGQFSFRITRDWRVIFQFIDARTIQLLHALHRKDAYR